MTVSLKLQGCDETFLPPQVWEDNLEEELALIRDVIDDYPYLAMGKTNIQHFARWHQDTLMEIMTCFPVEISQC